MKREEIITFIEKIRPQIKEAGAPDDVLLKEAAKANLAPAQLESTAQLLNTAQQLHFMDKSAKRGDSFKLIDVPELLDKFTRHEMPKAAREKAPTFSEELSYLEKSATVKKRDGKYVLLSSEGKVLGTHDSAKEAWAQEYAIQKSKERKEKSASVALQDPDLDRPLRGKRMPNVNAIALKDAGARSEYIPVSPAPSLPKAARSVWRESLQKEAAEKFELEGLNQLIADENECLRKEAETVAFRLRTEPSFYWHDAKADALALNKEAAEKACAVIEQYLGSLTGHRKVSFCSVPGETGILAEDRYDIMPTIEKVAASVEQIEKIAVYRDHIKQAVSAPPKPVENEEEGTEEEEGRRNAAGGGGNRNRTENENEGTSVINPIPEGENLLDIIVRPNKPTPTPEERYDEVSDMIGSGMKGTKEILDKIPGPKDITEGAQDALQRIAPKKNKPQKLIDEAHADTKAVTNIQRLMLTDPIIREADPDMVLSLYNTLRSANPEVTSDPNLLRFALRESLQYESVPLHTYKDLIEMDERKSKARSNQSDLEKDRYKID